MSDSQDPYRPPESRLAETEPISSELASRRSRLFASIADGLLLTIPLLPLLWWSGRFDGFPDVEPLGALENLRWTVTGWLLFLAVNGRLLADRGQSLGKLLLGIRIVRSDLSPCSFGRILLARLLPFWVIGLVPTLGLIAGFVNVLTIFGASRRCLHDRLADTLVVKVPKRATAEKTA